MTDFISHLFSDKYANHKAIGDNTLLLMMYRFAFPFAYILNKAGITPNSITTMSTFFALLAAIFLVFGFVEITYVTCWGISILLDFCDGTVARMSGNTSKTALRYDHMSDVFKIFVIMLATGAYYDSLLIWVLTMTASFFFLYYMLFNEVLSSATELLVKQQNTTRKPTADLAKGKKQSIIKLAKSAIQNDFLLKFVKGLYVILTTVNGHTLLIFLMIPFGDQFVLDTFSYFTLLCLLGVFNHISALRKIPKIRILK